MRTLFFLFLSLLTFLSCQNLESEKKKIIHESNNNLDSNQIFSVYRLTQNTTAIVIPIDNTTDSKYSKLFDKYFQQDSLYQFISKEKITKTRAKYFFDTLNDFLLLRHKQLEKEIKKIVPSEFYIYGLNGLIKLDIADVIINISACESNFIGLIINNYPTLTCGEAIFASSKKIELKYVNNNSIDDKIDLFISEQNYDYSDSIRVKSFAKYKDFYFTYLDDFKWYDSKFKSKCLFPNRMIYKINNGKVSQFWGNGLDLYGIACD